MLATAMSGNCKSTETESKICYNLNDFWLGDGRSFKSGTCNMQHGTRNTGNPGKPNNYDKYEENL